MCSIGGHDAAHPEDREPPRQPAGGAGPPASKLTRPGGSGGPPGVSTSGPGEAGPPASTLTRLAHAIEELSVTLRSNFDGGDDTGALAARLAGIWTMIAELDPAVAARLPGYDTAGE